MHITGINDASDSSFNSVTKCSLKINFKMESKLSYPSTIKDWDRVPKEESLQDIGDAILREMWRMKFADSVEILRRIWEKTDGEMMAQVAQMPPPGQFCYICIVAMTYTVTNHPPLSRLHYCSAIIMVHRLLCKTHLKVIWQLSVMGGVLSVKVLIRVLLKELQSADQILCSEVLLKDRSDRAVCRPPRPLYPPRVLTCL